MCKKWILTLFYKNGSLNNGPIWKINFWHTLWTKPVLEIPYFSAHTHFYLSLAEGRALFGTLLQTPLSLFYKNGSLNNGPIWKINFWHTLWTKPVLEIPYFSAHTHFYLSLAEGRALFGTLLQTPLSSSSHCPYLIVVQPGGKIFLVDEHFGAHKLVA